MKKQYIIFLTIGIAILVIAAAMIAVPYVASHIKERNAINDCQEEMERTAILYLEENAEGFDPSKWKFTSMRSEGRSEDALKYNSEHPDGYVYPFLKTEFQFAKKGVLDDNERWVVYFRLTDDLQQEIEKIELVTNKSWE